LDIVQHPVILSFEFNFIYIIVIVMMILAINIVIIMKDKFPKSGDLGSRL